MIVARDDDQKQMTVAISYLLNYSWAGKVKRWRGRVDKACVTRIHPNMSLLL
jgi:hypothetical protein